MKNTQSIGILGGMSPVASSKMYDSLIQLSIQHFGAVNNDDFPEIILYSIPVPDFISNDIDQAVALEMLKSRVKDLNKLNISSLAIACNTAHILLGDLQVVANAPFVSVIEEVAQEVKKDRLKNVGVLGSPSIIKSRLYQNALEKLDIEIMVPTKKQQLVLDNIIRNVIKGNLVNNDFTILIGIIDDLVAKGAGGIILGCTELPIIFPLQYKIPVYNSVEILCMALLRRYYESNTIDTI